MSSSAGGHTWFPGFRKPWALGIVSKSVILCFRASPALNSSFQITSTLANVIISQHRVVAMSTSAVVLQKVTPRYTASRCR